MLGDPPNYNCLWKTIFGDERKVQRGDLYQIIHLAAQVAPEGEVPLLDHLSRVGRVLGGPWCGGAGKLEAQSGRMTGPRSFSSPRRG